MKFPNMKNIFVSVLALRWGRREVLEGEEVVDIPRLIPFVEVTDLRARARRG
jgi:hypothetical protein